MRALLSAVSVLSALAASVPVLVSCTHELDDAAAPAVVADDLEQAVTFAVPSDVPSERVYLGSTNWVHTDSEWPWHYGVFDVNPKGRVLIELYDSNAWLPVGFKVYRVTADGALVHLGTVDGPDGYAAAVLTTRSGGSYVVESVGAEAPATLALDLTCTRHNGDCSPNLQPEETCGTRGVGGVCDEGLFCQIAEGCGRDDRGGTCTRPVQMCPAVYGPPVCGCDGQTWGTACSANSAGVNVDFMGECACDPSVWSKNIDGPVEVAGTWTWKGPYGENDITATLTLNSDGTFHYGQVWDPQCLHVEPYCRRASLLFGMSGTWENQGFAVQLLPVMEEGVPAPLELAQSFGVETTCDGGVRLVTTELDQERVFALDGCSGVTCPEAEHCEMVQVQCITTPCPPLPTCVADG